MEDQGENLKKELMKWTDLTCRRRGERRSGSTETKTDAPDCSARC